MHNFLIVLKGELNQIWNHHVRWPCCSSYALFCHQVVVLSCDMGAATFFTAAVFQHSVFIRNHTQDLNHLHYVSHSPSTAPQLQLWNHLSSLEPPDDVLPEEAEETRPATGSAVAVLHCYHWVHPHAIHHCLVQWSKQTSHSEAAAHHSLSWEDHRLQTAAHWSLALHQGRTVVGTIISDGETVNQCTCHFHVLSNWALHCTLHSTSTAIQLKCWLHMSCPLCYRISLSGYGSLLGKVEDWRS